MISREEEKRRSRNPSSQLKMEKVVATVSGYHGTERFDIIKLITLSGANYVGGMSPSTTHLVCSKFEEASSKKFRLAIKLRIFIISPLWFRDCFKARNRIPEQPYVLRSGQQISGSFRLHQLTHKPPPRNLLIHLSNEECSWSPSPLVNELLLQNSLPKSSAISKRKAAKKPVEEQQCLLTKYFQGSSSSDDDADDDDDDVRIEGESSSWYTTRSVRRKKDTCNAVKNSSLAETSCKGWRLLKRNTSENLLVRDLSDSEQAFDSVETRYPRPTIRPPSIRPDTGTNENLLISSRNSPIELHGGGGGGGIVDSLEGIESSYPDASLSGVSNDEDQNENMTELTSSMELSCVICWTDFSSTRGVLPCGHRFCYSCIQNWADHMASMGKMSTCPLCKASFVSIMKFDDAETFGQKIYSQTIPCAASTSNVYVLPHREPTRIGALSSTTAVCSGCQFREPEDFLISCHGCHSHCIHSYCLDPPLLPWICIHCKDRRTLFNQFR